MRDRRLADWAGARLPAFEAALVGPFDGVRPERLAEVCRYPLRTGGKRLRPLLCMAAAEGVGGSGEDPAVGGAAVAVELVHTYSLVHDDLPALDDDDLRRGQPTAHVAFGEAAAILAGDALLTEAFAVLAALPLSAERRVALVGELAGAAGIRGMVAGQAEDIGMDGSIRDLAGLERVHRNKTGALLRAAVRMGGIAAGADAPALAALGRYGEAVGLAFQLADDVLDADQDAGEDGPPSYVRLLGAPETTRRARALAEAAIEALAGLPAPGILRALALYAVERDR
jgi:geranylgeranyl pyrophosphate synthase